jgi:hypothetical protein
MSQYHDNLRRSAPDDEYLASDGWRIMRNGKLFARRKTLGAAYALVARVERLLETDKWEIKP